jgi:DNA-binding NtrC family response regulator
VIDIRIPPLRERREDILVLFEHFLRRYAEARGIPPPTLSGDATSAIIGFEWPGNVRQLKNVAERLIVRAERSIITAADLPPEFMARLPVRVAAPAARPAIEDVFDRMVKHRESFWSAVYPAFMTRDLTRSDLRFIVQRGLQETAGNYKMLVELLNMKPTDYKRFLNFLRKHECHVPFARFRSAGLRRRPRPDEDFDPAHLLDGAPPVMEDGIAIGDALPAAIARR